ncbi:MAG: polymer-forming cytoskeletal protein [Spirochaetales bacterium]|nr:polymer-forming cytoskeletal protein [Spirochaetales bacterium]
MEDKILNPVKCVTTFGKTTKFNGNLKFSTSLNIQGNFSGDINSDGFLYVDKTGVIDADVRVKSIVVAGYVSGNIYAEDKIEITPTGVVKGNIEAKTVKMADGHEFVGSLKMLEDVNSIDIFSTSTDKLKRMLAGA